MRLLPFACPFVIVLGVSTSVSGQTQQPLPAVVVEKATTMKAELTDKYVGRVEAISTIDIVARVEGFLEQRNFIEGDLVKKGQVLYQIEKGTYEASLKDAQAELEGAKATALEAQLDVERQKALLASNDISQSTYDSAVATLGADNAAVGEAEADVQTAQINLSYTTVSSPIDGRISVTAVNVGNLVDSDSGTLATIVSIDPIYVSFYISERDLLEKRQQGLIGENSSLLEVKLTLSDGSDYGSLGKINYVGNEIESTTDTIQMRATFENKDALLIPEQVVTVTFNNPDAKEELVIGQTAIQLDAKGHFVFVLNQNDEVERKDVTLGNQIGRDWAVKSGLKAGDRVVVQGLQKIHEGMKVAPTEIQS
ncbi:efflux RND transporter periplasmic adaptor subunit [Roseibium sp. RKSG952]|uniref:efflux RND transporter periplasmic adaptor subunit n=1 Tax=Roseibium sp. RKSG952 TaxID=2529384 RepID=UPI0018AD1B7D|nr:efflux RND transporter periplasmic adaptor subunit [Roseibium sp. RKSG952]